MSAGPILKIAALGDSISTGFNARNAGDNPDLSWSTGTTQVTSSHRIRLAAAVPSCRVEAKNAAVSGSRATQLVAQAESLTSFAPDYATVLIGANDLSEWTLGGEYGVRLDRFEADVRKAVKTLITANARVMIVLAGVPDQARVVDVLLKRGGIASTSPWLDNALVPGLRRAYAERHARMESALASIAGTHKANIRFAGGVGRAQFQADHLSPLDSYHPSVKGQELLAELTWREGWF